MCFVFYLGCPSGYTELSSLDCDTGMCPTNVCSGKNKCCLKRKP